jgi:hypothetical protein
MTQLDIAHFRNHGLTHLWINCTALGFQMKIIQRASVIIR